MGWMISKKVSRDARRCIKNEIASRQLKLICRGGRKESGGLRQNGVGQGQASKSSVTGWTTKKRMRRLLRKLPATRPSKRFKPSRVAKSGNYLSDILSGRANI